MDYFFAKYTPSGFVYVSESFFLSMALLDIIKGEIACMGTSPGRAWTHTHQLERDQEHLGNKLYFICTLSIQVNKVFVPVLFTSMPQLPDNRYTKALLVTLAPPTACLQELGCFCLLQIWSNSTLFGEMKNALLLYRAEIGICFFFKLQHFTISLLLQYFYSNKCSLCEHKRLFKNTEIWKIFVHLSRLHEGVE